MLLTVVVLPLVTGITLGLATPYWMYWSIKYFFDNMHVKDYSPA